MLGTGAEMWGDAALGCKANKHWNEGINPPGDKRVAVKKASLDYRKLQSWYKSWAHGSCREQGWELLTQARAEGSCLTPPSPGQYFGVGSDSRESKTLGRAQGASRLGGHVRPCCTNAPGAPLAVAGCTGRSALRISEVTAERSPRGPVAHHLLPSSQQAPAVSSVPVLVKYLHSAVQPKGFEDKGPLTPSHRGARHQNARMQQPASVHM